MSESERPSAELRRLVNLTCDGELSPEEHARLQEILSSDASARAFYRECLLLHGELAWSDVARRATTARSSAPASSPLPLDPCHGAEHPLLDSIGTSFQQILGFFSRPMVFSLLVALVLPGVVLAVLLVDLALHPPERAAMAPMPLPVMPASVNKSVARITRTDCCVWGEANQDPTVGTRLFSNQRLELNAGLVEVMFDDGARMIVEGPSTFEARRGGGFLHRGRLVARVPKGAEGFTVETPTATVVDYGTEFGVAVDEDQAAAEVHVFEGEVALEARSAASATATSSERQRLTAGMAARVETVGTSATVVIRQIASSDAQFARSLRPEAGPEITAHFTQGDGMASVDQYPGVPGEGWASGWSHREADGINCDVSVERTEPLLGGGDYLRLLAERKRGTAAVRRALERHLELTDRVDLTKPYVVSFDFRIDQLAGFSTRNDYILLCNNGIPEASPRPRVASGWHISVFGQGSEARHWTFVGRDEQGKGQSVDSRIPVVEGSVYSFRILFEPESQRWTPSISVDGGPWIDFEAMGVRSGGSAQEFGYWPILAVWWRMDGDSSNDEREAIGFSIDSVRIRSVDEATVAR